MPTVKLVVIGPSGVGKTSLRGKYIEGHFSTGYRATIGADFITKVLPHPTNPAESVTLQIWDTAGQERFSSLSTAFFRGADAALLLFDVNSPETMHSLKKWWSDFCDRAPLADGDMHDYCCVVVGNKIDMAGKSKPLVSESEALEFLDELVPAEPSIDFLPPAVSSGSPQLPSQSPSEAISISIAVPSSSIAIPPSIKSGTSERDFIPSTSPKHQLFKSRSRSSSRFYAGTMTTTHTTLTIYHTPSSSMFDVYQSARASPEPWTSPSPEPATEMAASPPLQSGLTPRQRTLTMLSTGSTSSGSAPTITPSLVAREREAAKSGGTSQPVAGDSAFLPSESPANGMPPLPPERGPRLFFTSAKTGEGVADVFEYIARRVVQKWEYDEWVDARTMHFREASGNGNTIRLEDKWNKKKLSDCCSS